MSDQDLADLLGTAPAKGPDPVFRFDVLTRAAAHARRRKARARALRYVGVLTLVGLAGAGLQSIGVDAAAFAAAGVCVFVYAIAQVAIAGPRRAFERSRALLQAGL
jgi:hypothetical protein